MLTVIEGRVLGCLLEKERTTPDQYPLTLNALVLACNQATSREPVMRIESHDAEAAITSLKAAGLARLVHPSHGRSVTRSRQVTCEHFGWTEPQAAIMAVLLLRGPQTVNELRARTERQHNFRSPDDVEVCLGQLASTSPVMVVRLLREVGQKEPRWQQLLADEVEPSERPEPITTSGRGPDRIAELEARVARLEAALADLLD